MLIIVVDFVLQLLQEGNASKDCHITLVLVVGATVRMSYGTIPLSSGKLRFASVSIFCHVATAEN